ncbi:EamA family transporter [Alkalicoccus urumqiensis]|uniref:EamA family transporter n=2 Tax=Alkalicoccus urumqiensis TaxID=1548213 RepID=A0A2P6MJ67_ALKUR|nr:EamA family transporter [Alkalicoccus urumqiensis]
MKELFRQSFGYILVIAGAACWGLTGLFVDQLYQAGFTPWQVVAARMSSSAFVLFLVLILFEREHLRIDRRDLPYLILLGLCGMSLFNGFYFAVMDRASLAIAVVFVYTSPIFASLIAKFAFGEQLSLQKNMAIVLTIIGCAMAIGFIPLGGSEPIDLLTVFLGLMAGLFCASYSLIGKYVSGRYHPLTITFYGFTAGSVISVPTSAIWQQTSTVLQIDVLLPMLALTFIATIAAYLLFTLGLAYVESSRAAILSSTELVVSVLLSVFVLNEIVTFWQAVGFVLVITSIMLTVVSFRRRVERKYPGKEYSYTNEG